MADKYAIYLGTSHCEPMMRNTNGEWKRPGKGSMIMYTTGKCLVFLGGARKATSSFG